jgi:hypothetical protein
MNMTLPVFYVEPPDVPVGMTLDQYRRQQAPARRFRRRRGLRLRMLRAVGLRRPA